MKSLSKNLAIKETVIARNEKNPFLTPFFCEIFKDLITMTFKPTEFEFEVLLHSTFAL